MPETRRKPKKKLADLNVAEATAADQLKAATAALDYHTRKQEEWSKAARDEHDLDKALLAVEKARAELTAATAAEAAVKGAHDQAAAAKKVAEDKKVLAEANKAEALKQLKADEDQLETHTANMGLLNDQLTALQKNDR